MDDPFGLLALAPMLAFPQFPAHAAEFLRQACIHFESRKAERRRSQGVNRRTIAPGSKQSGAGGNRAPLDKILSQPKSIQYFLAASADKFAADPMTRVVSGLENSHGHFLLSQ